MSEINKRCNEYVYYYFGYFDPLGGYQNAIGYRKIDERDSDIVPMGFFPQNDYGDDVILIPFHMGRLPAVHTFLECYVRQQINTILEGERSTRVYQLEPDWRDKFTEDSRII